MLGAVYTDRPTVQPLTPLLWLGRIHARKPQYQEVTRLFAALSMGIAELETFYSKVDFDVVSDARVFPHITSFIDRGTRREVKFRYEGYADPIPGGTRAVFVAKTEDDRKIVVKFAETYNDVAHALLAAQGFAPQMFSCDRSTLAGFVIVIMDYVNGKQLRHKYHEGSRIPTKILRQIRNALDHLHGEGFVFGDLRWPNVLITGEPVHIKLVDFDWCGKVREGEYPPDINHVATGWPEGVVPGGLMQFEHDKEMLMNL